MLILLLSLLGLLASQALGLPPAVQRFRQTHHTPIKTGPLSKRSSGFTIPRFTNPRAAEFHVNSSALPLVTFPLQDSWAGRLPIDSDAGETKELFFWYWPSSAPGGSKDLTIWLNGGPGCSSMEGFLQENGPISMEPGTTTPTVNPYAWTGVSDVLYVDQPVGSGYSIGTPNITNEVELADQFYGFLQQFFTVFNELAEKPLYMTGESYAGFYIPYIASRIVNASPSEKLSLPLEVQGLLINDGVYSSFIVSEEAPVYRFAASHQTLLNITDSQLQILHNISLSCGYESMLDQVTYPQKGKIWLPNGNKDMITEECDVFDLYYTFAAEGNPCFNVYRVTDGCPTPVDPIEGYFSRPDVQALLHVNNSGPWSECSNYPVFAGDGGDYSAYTETLLPSLIPALPRGVTLWHGLDDGLLFSEGDRLMIQNMTWGGGQGFAEEPRRPLVFRGERKGVWGEERGLRYLEVEGAGHMIPQDQPALALHVFSSMLGLTTL